MSRLSSPISPIHRGEHHPADRRRKAAGPGRQLLGGTFAASPSAPAREESPPGRPPWPSGSPPAASSPAPSATVATAVSGALPDTGFLRQPQVLRLVPVSKSTLWRRVQDRSFPQPVRLAGRITVWRVEDIRCWIAQQGGRS